MDYVNPKEVAATMLQSALVKSSLSPRDILVRGALSGALLGISVALACLAATQTGFGIAGAVVFPVGFVIIVILGLELVTGSFALVPLAFFERRISAGRMLANLSLAFVANLLGSMLFGVLFWLAASEGNVNHVLNAVEQQLVVIAERKTVGYAQHGAGGFVAAFVKAILCNWMVCMGVVMAMTSRSTPGKILAAGMPIFIFFALGYEHAVVNMFVIPTGMLLGADVTLSDWWLHNQLIVTAGNLVGGLLFTGLPIYYSLGKPGGLVKPNEQQGA